MNGVPRSRRTEVPGGLDTPALVKLAAGPGNVGLTRRRVSPPQPGEALIEVVAAGICGTDLHIVDDEFPSAPPVTMGHEVTGIVTAVGDDRDGGWVGQRVAVETYFSYCGTCEFCRAGRNNLCAQRRSIGSHVDGGFAAWLVLPARNLHAVPQTVGRFAAALCEPLACVCHCLCDPSVVSPGDRVLVTGPGTMGVLAAQVARAAGAQVSLVGTERDAERLALARSLGLDTTPLDEADVVVECSGNAGGAAACLRAVRRGGRYVQVGIFGRAVSLTLDALIYREVTVTSGFASTPTSWRRAMRLLAAEAVTLDPLVSEVVALGDWEHAFSATRQALGMKFVLDPRTGVEAASDQTREDGGVG